MKRNRYRAHDTLFAEMPFVFQAIGMLLSVAGCFVAKRKEPVTSVAISADGKRIVSGGGELVEQRKPAPGEVKVWDRFSSAKG